MYKYTRTLYTYSQMNLNFAKNMKLFGDDDTALTKSKFLWYNVYTKDEKESIVVLWINACVDMGEHDICASECEYQHFNTYVNLHEKYTNSDDDNHSDDKEGDEKYEDSDEDVIISISTNRYCTKFGSYCVCFKAFCNEHMVTHILDFSINDMNKKHNEILNNILIHYNKIQFTHLLKHHKQLFTSIISEDSHRNIRDNCLCGKHFIPIICKICKIRLYTCNNLPWHKLVCNKISQLYI